MVTIKKASELTGLSVKAIRHYENVGLCCPEVRTDAGYRLYMPRDLARLNRIRYFRDLGFPLQEITRCLSANEEELRQALAARRIQVQKNIKREQRALTTINAVLSLNTMKIPPGGVAVVNIDLQNDLIEGGALTCKRIFQILPRLEKLFSRARARGVPVIYICDWHERDDPELLLWNDHMIAGSWGAEIIDSVAPQDGDYIIHKNRFNAFVNTDLQVTMDALNIRTIIFTGWRTDVCIAQTAIEAFYRGYRVILAEDGMESTSQSEHNFGMAQMSINYAFECYPCETVLDDVLQESQE